MGTSPIGVSEWKWDLNWNWKPPRRISFIIQLYVCTSLWPSPPSHPFGAPPEGASRSSYCREGVTRRLATIWPFGLDLQLLLLCRSLRHFSNIFQFLPLPLDSTGALKNEVSTPLRGFKLLHLFCFPLNPSSWPCCVQIAGP